MSVLLLWFESMAKIYRVLLGEDDDIVGDMYQIGLEGLGWEVIRGRNGSQVIRSAGRDRPDVVLLDMHMPGITGSAVVGALMADLSSARIPVLLLTNEDAQGEDVVKARALGAKAVLQKTDTPPRLLSEVMHRTIAEAGTKPV